MDELDSIKRCCTLCSSEKPLTDFVKDKFKPSGYRYQCKSCENARRRGNPKRLARELARYYRERAQHQARRKASYEAQRETALEKQKEYYEANRDAILGYQKQYRADNKEAKRDYNRAYGEVNRERIARQKREYAEQNPEVVKNSRRNRYARIRGATGSHTAGDVKSKYDEQGGECYWCAVPLDGDYQVDHIIPISKGGGNGPGNICCSCQRCNNAKYNKMPWEFSDRLF